MINHSISRHHAAQYNMPDTISALRQSAVASDTSADTPYSLTSAIGGCLPGFAHLKADSSCEPCGQPGRQAASEVTSTLVRCCSNEMPCAEIEPKREKEKAHRSIWAGGKAGRASWELGNLSPR